MSIGTPIPTAQAQLDPDDPWPKYGRDPGITCYSPHRGPHEPQLRWWAELEPEDHSVTYRLRGAAIAKLGPNDERYVLVGTRADKVLVFRFHPSAGEWVDETRLEAQWVNSIPVSGPVNSTPLVLADDTVVIQTDSTLEVWDLSNPASEQLKWKATGMDSHAASPATAAFVQDGTTHYIFTKANGAVYCFDVVQTKTLLDPATDSEWWYLLETSDHGHGCPAVGPVYNSTDVGLYVACFTETIPQPHLYALYADGNGGSPIGWSDGINDYVGQIQKGTFASPSVHKHQTLAGDIFVGSDDMGAYAFSCDWGLNNHRRWVDRHDYYVYISATAGLTPHGTYPQLIYWNEDGLFMNVEDRGGSAVMLGSVNPDIGVWSADDRAPWVGGAPVVDSNWREIREEYEGRFYVNTPGNPSNENGCRVLAYAYPFDRREDPRSPIWQWGDASELPLDSDLEPVDRLRYSSPIVMDEDGTLICVSHRYLFALRPLVADFDGDGCVTSADLAALMTALTNPTQWEQTWGTPNGLNLLGVGDCNNDGLFNNFDLTCLGHLIQSRAQREDGVDWEFFYELLSELMAMAEVEVE